MKELWIRWKPWLFFAGLIFIWICGIVLPLYPQLLFDVPADTNPYVGIAGAVIGAGPFILQAIYTGYVDQPRFVITTESDEDGIEGVYFDKLLLSVNDSVYPVIECVTTIKNVGTQSVTDASVRVNLTCSAASIDEQEYYSRWTGDLYAPSTDIHPGRERELVLFQIVPTQDCLDDLDIVFEDEETEVAIDDFVSLRFDSSNRRELIDDVPGELFLQRPLNPDSEKFEYEIEEIPKEDQRRFIGRHIPCPDAYDVSLYLTSQDWSGPISVGTVPLDEKILRGRWHQVPESYQPLQDALEQIGWTS